MKSIAYFLLCAGLALSAACARTSTQERPLEGLEAEIESIAAEYPGQIGVALITDGGDTLTAGNDDAYPLMSVVKLHQAIALSRKLGSEGGSLDSTVTIPRAQLNPDTWSPMLADYPAADSIVISLRRLLDYALTLSDNNASDYLFAHLQSPAQTDSAIAAIIPREGFGIAVAEAQMFADHSLAARNHTSPLSAAMLMNRLFTDSLSAEDPWLRATLGHCTTGVDRIAAPLDSIAGVSIAHKTGSGYSSGGILAAHNDLAFITLPDGRTYTLAVFVRDLRGTESDASAAISRISSAVYSAITAE